MTKGEIVEPKMLSLMSKEVTIRFKMHDVINVAMFGDLGSRHDMLKCKFYNAIMILS